MISRSTRSICSALPRATITVIPKTTYNVSSAPLRMTVGIGSPQMISKRFKASQQHLTIHHLGVPHVPYIPLSYRNLPNPITSPKVFLQCLFKRLAAFGTNTYHIVNFRNEQKPNFPLWRNQVIENYAAINKAFATRNLRNVRNKCASVVYEALVERSKTLPKDYLFDWKLIKFNSVPKIVSFIPLPAENGATLFIQVIYKFDTKQQLISIPKKGGESKVQEKNMVEYIAININPYTNESCIAGSVFESLPTDVFRKETAETALEMSRVMKANADIYRADPTRDNVKMIKDN